MPGTGYGWNEYLDPTRDYGYLLLNTWPERVGRITPAVVLANFNYNIGWFEACPIVKNVEQFSGHGKFDVVMDTYSKQNFTVYGPFHLWSKDFSVAFYVDSCPAHTKSIWYSKTDPNMYFHTCSTLLQDNEQVLARAQSRCSKGLALPHFVETGANL